MSRWKAAAIHFGISAAVALALATLMSLTWYPPLLAWTVGKLGIMGILFAVDVSIGPLLTLLVFKAGKPRLKFDLGVIAALQVLGFLYGVHVLYQARLVYLVFSVDSFHPVTAVDIPRENLDKASRTPRWSLPLGGPETVAVRLPQDPEEKFKLTLKTISGGADVHQYPEFYVPYPQAKQDVLKRALPLQKLLERDEETRAKLAGWLLRHRREAASVKYVPLYGTVHDLTVLLDGGTAEILDTLLVNPV